LKFLLGTVLLLVLAAAGAAAWLWYGITQPLQAFPAEGVFVDIPHGASSRGVARLLQRNGVVRNALAFEVYARRHPRRTMQAGEYFFDHPIAGKDVFWKIAKGEVYVLPFTVREGETMFDIAHELETAKFLPADDFLKAANDAELIHDIAPHAKTLEGFLYPATYNLPRHPTATELAAEMTHKFKEEWKKISASGMPEMNGAEQAPMILSTVTLASLVERETPRPEERPLVAGAFENRLHRGMPLQCDPTVIYALEQIGGYKGTLTGNDLHFDSPYNTYQHTGLPPGPVGNPGEASLLAALHPAETDYLYFVANTHGGHFFSATLAEHNKNVVKYRRLLAGLPGDPPPAPAPVAQKKKPAKKKHKGAAR
jgi:UPF0755 protein